MIDVKKDCKILILTVIEAKNLEIGSSLVVTPYGVNSLTNKFSDSIVFGKDDYLNDFNFPQDENVSLKQFEINYDISNIRINDKQTIAII